MKKSMLLWTAAAVLGAYLQDNLVTKTVYAIEDEIPKEFDGFNICHLSDFHDSNKFIQNQILKIIKKENPDIIVFSGDLIHTRITENIVNFVIQLRKIAPVYFVSGNHDAKEEYYLRLIKILESIGVCCLENKMKTIEKNGKSINIIGLTDPDYKNEYKWLREAILRKNIENISWDKNNYSILLSHRPEFIDFYEEVGVNIVFTGHAHGGQWRIPFIKKAVYCPDQGLFPKHTEGIIKKDKTKIVINRGIGNKAPVPRVNNYPEIIFCKIKSTRKS